MLWPSTCGCGTCTCFLAQGCEYGVMTDKQIRDRLVVGIRDESLSERLQIEYKLTLEQAKKFIRQREATKYTERG